MRLSLAKEALFNIRETISTNDLELILRRIKKPGVQVITTIFDNLKLSKKQLVHRLGNEKIVEEALMRCKAKGLIISERQRSKHYKYRLTGLIEDAVTALDWEKNV